MLLLEYTVRVQNPSCVMLNILQKNVSNLRKNDSNCSAMSGGEKQIHSGCKFCCRYGKNVVEMSVQIKTLKTKKFFNYRAGYSLLVLPSLSMGGIVCV